MKKNFVYSIILFLIIANFLSWITVLELNKPKFLEINFFDIRQGDSIFIETPQGYQILIDGGPSSKVVEKLGKELPFYDRSLDLIILTHPDPDHLNGLVEVLKSYKVDLIGFNGAKGTAPAFSEFENQIAKNKIKTAILQRGERISAGDNLYFEILAPFENFEGKEVKDFNSSSIVARLVYGKNEILFTGDAPRSIEKEMVAVLKETSLVPLGRVSEENLKSDILKIGHHGSTTSTTEEFLKEVLPKVAVISVGKDNQYGHPYKEILERLEKYGIRILRTDQNGDIKIFSDGENFRIIN